MYTEPRGAPGINGEVTPDNPEIRFFRDHRRRASLQLRKASVETMSRVQGCG